MSMYDVFFSIARGISRQISLKPTSGLMTKVILVLLKSIVEKMGEKSEIYISSVWWLAFVQFKLVSVLDN